MKRVKLNINNAIELATKNNGKCLSTSYINNCSSLIWQCSKGHQWQANYNNIKHGRWCPTCYKLEIRGNNRRLQSNVHREIAAKNNGKCLTEIYKNNKQKMIWECDKGHQWSSRLDAIKDQGSWCPKCRSTKNYYENKTRSIFERIFQKSFESVRPDFLKNPETDCNLELDGYCEELKLAFEYDGRTHYQEWDNKSSDMSKLQYIQKNDALKDKLCKQAGIALIRVPYWESLNLEDFIKDKIEELYGKKESY